jgi:hypothetical protein
MSNNKSFKGIAVLGIMSMNQNCIREEIKRRLNSGECLLPFILESSFLPIHCPKK